MSDDVVTSDGWRLAVNAQRGGNRGTVLLLHAMMADGRTWSRPQGRGLAQRLLGAGFDVCQADFRGHGDSGPRAADGGTWTYDDLVLRDVPALVHHARRWGRGPIAVVGHSLGGHVTAASVGVGATRIDALVCVAANIWLPQHEPSLRARCAKASALAGMSALSSLVGRFPARRLSVGSADEASPYVEDLRRPWVTGRWLSADKRLDYLEGLASIDIPALGIVGRGDTLFARPAGAVGWIAAIPHVQTWVAGEGAHGVTNAPSHMGLVTGAGSDPLHARLVAWLGARLTAR